MIGFFIELCVVGTAMLIRLTIVAVKLFVLLSVALIAMVARAIDSWQPEARR